MIISNVEIVPVENSSIRNYLAEVIVIIDFDFKIREIKLMQGSKGYYLLFPIDRRNRGIAYPVSDDVRREILDKAVSLWESVNE